MGTEHSPKRLTLSIVSTEDPEYTIHILPYTIHGQEPDIFKGRIVTRRRNVEELTAPGWPWPLRLESSDNSGTLEQLLQPCSPILPKSVRYSNSATTVSGAISKVNSKQVDLV